MLQKKEEKSILFVVIVLLFVYDDDGGVASIRFVVVGLFWTVQKKYDTP